MPAIGRAKDLLNTGLRPLGVQVIRGRSTDPAIRTFISARKTIADAKKSGLPLGDYIDKTFAQPGATQATVDAMLKLGGLESADRVCEIGPGSGRYMTRVMDKLQPKAYEVYESAVDWLPYLRSFPQVVVRQCDGRTLSETPTSSVDLVHAQKVFVYLEFWTTVSYLHEMVRVTRPGGVIAFDVVTEQCLSDAAINGWIESGTIFRPVPHDWIIDHLAQRQVSYVGSHISPLNPQDSDVSEFMVFRRE